MLPPALSCTPAPPFPELHFLSVFVIYMRVCFYCLMRAGTHPVLSGGGLIYAVVAVCFPSQRAATAAKLLLSSRCSPSVSPLYAFTLKMNVWLLFLSCFCC